MKRFFITILLASTLLAGCTVLCDDLVLETTTAIVKEYDANTEILIGTKTKPGLLDLIILQNPGNQSLISLREEVRASAQKVRVLADKLKELILACSIPQETQDEWIGIIQSFIDKIGKEE